MRELTLEELELVAGGEGSDIVVSGNPGGDWGDFGDYGGGDYGGGDYGGGDSGGGDSSPPPTHQSFDVGTHHVDTSNLHDPLTADQQKALDDFAKSLAKDDAAVHSIDDRAQLHLDNGTANGLNITGAELKGLWDKANFTVNDPGTQYANGTTRGESDYNGGNPQISFNVDLMQGYDQAANGMDFLPLHELGHLVAEPSGYTSERIANDVARATEEYSGIPTYNESVNGYSPSDPQWQVPQ